MEETKENGKEVVPETTEDTGDGDKSETTSLIDKANTAAERLEAANKKKEDLLNRQEEIAAKSLLGGKSDAATEKKKEEISDKDYSDKVLSGDANPLKEDGYI